MNVPTPLCTIPGQRLPWRGTGASAPKMAAPTSREILMPRARSCCRLSPAGGQRDPSDMPDGSV